MINHNAASPVTWSRMSIICIKNINNLEPTRPGSFSMDNNNTLSVLKIRGKMLEFLIFVMMKNPW